MSTAPAARSAAPSVSQTFFVVTCWAFFGLFVWSANVAQSGGGFDTPLSAFVRHFPYGLGALIFILSLWSGSSAARDWGLIGGPLYVVCMVISAVSLVATAVLAYLFVF